MTTKTGIIQTKNQIQELMLKLKLIQMPLSEKREENMKKLIMPTFPEDQTSFQDTTVKQLSEKLPTDGKETQITLDQPNFQLPSLQLKLKSIQMDQLVLSHKKLISNLMEFNNLKNHSTSQIKKSPMTTKTDTMLIKNQIQVLMLRSRLIQTLL